VIPEVTSEKARAAYQTLKDTADFDARAYFRERLN
jgi:hypothetical protein